MVCLLVVLGGGFGGCAAQSITPPAALQAPSSAAVTANPASLGIANPASAPWSLPRESLVACFQREALSGTQTIMSLATQQSTSSNTGPQFRELRIDADPDLVTRYAETVLAATRENGASPEALNSQLMRADMACIDTQLAAAESAPQSANTHPVAASDGIDISGLQRFAATNRALKNGVSALYANAGEFLAIADQESIPEQIGRRFHARTLRLIDNSGLIAQQQRQQTASR